MSEINIIVPVYNSERYLPELLDSVVEQEFKDYTIIIVNDCSTDSSEKIILKYQENFRDKLVYVKNKKNIKQGPSRNVGLKISEQLGSRYTVFLDADDIIEPDFLSKMYAKAEDELADIVICGIERFDDSTRSTICYEAIRGKCIDIIKKSNMHELAYLNPAPYNKLYKSSVIKGYRFNQMKRSEDTCYFFEILRNVSKIVFTNSVLYHYRIHGSSLTGMINEDVCDSMMSGFAELLDKVDYKNSGYKDELETQVFIRVACGGVCRASFSNIKQSDELITKVNNYLDRVIPDWRTNQYLKMTLQFGNVRALLLRVIALLYKIGLAKLFIYMYYFQLKVLKKDIRM